MAAATRPSIRVSTSVFIFMGSSSREFNLASMFFVFDRGLHGYRGCDEQKETQGNEDFKHRTPNTEHRTPNTEHRTSKAEEGSGFRVFWPSMSISRDRF